MRKITFILALVLMTAFAGEVLALDIPSLIKERYQGMSTFKATFVQELTHKETGKKETRNGTLAFKKPLLIRWETKAPHAELLVVTDKEIWNHLPDEQVAYRYPRSMVEDSRSVIQVVTGQALLSKDFDIEEQGMEDGLAKVKLFPREPAPSMVEAVLWVDTDQGLIRRATIRDFYGNTNAVKFTNILPDAGLPSSSFNFKPGKDVEIEDRTQGGAGKERELFN